MQIQENEVNDILGIVNIPDKVGGKRKKKRKSQLNAQMTEETAPIRDEESTSSVIPMSSSEASLVVELAETKQRLEKVTKDMEGMKNEIEVLRMASPKPLRIFALGFIPSVVLAKNHVELLKWVSDVLANSMKKRMAEHGNHFKVIQTVSGVEAVGARTCPTFNRIEQCSVKWHHMTKSTKTGRSRSELRLHCCTLCLEALGIISGHPLLRCPWIYEETWKRIES